MAGRILAVAQTTFRETVRNKVLLHILGFAGVMLALSWIISRWSVGEPEKIVADIGLSATTLAGVAIALFSGIALVWGEVEQRTILPILAKPLPRREYLIGKFLGFSAAVQVVYLAMCTVLILLLAIVESGITHQLFAAIYLSMWEVEIVVALALLFSTFNTPTVSALYTVILFVVGRLSSDVRIFVDRYPETAAKPLLEAVYAIIPHLSYFNIRRAAVHTLPLDWDRLLYSTFYGALYCVILMTIAILVFRRRDLA
ncbi:MAG: hypothetical protein FJY65_10890 [Calditrichaeota bacterium]|nr:hypothetical protein [Calditrichota bacterium]